MSILKNKKILITGGAGFIGSHLAVALLRKKYQVTIVDNLSTGSLKNIKDIRSKIKFIHQDLANFLVKKKDLSVFDLIFHLAGNPYIPPSVKNPKFDFKQNLTNTFLLLEALRKTSNPPILINISSAAVYGSPRKMPISETDPTVPVSPYGVSKLAAERYVAVYSLLYGIKTANLRFFSVFGPGQKKQIIFDLLKKIRENSNILRVYGDGSQVRDFIYVDDLVRAIILIVKKSSLEGEVYNIASGKSWRVSDVIKMVCRISKVNPEIKYSGENRPGDAEIWEVDIAKIQKLGFKANVNLEEGILKVKKWISKEKKLKNIYE